jgi:hypothetical protein
MKLCMLCAPGHSEFTTPIPSPLPIFFFIPYIRLSSRSFWIGGDEFYIGYELYVGDELYGGGKLVVRDEFRHGCFGHRSDVV